VLFPGDVVTVELSGETSRRALDRIERLGGACVALALSDPDGRELDPANLLRVGTVATLVRRVQLPGGAARVALRGHRRTHVERLLAGSGETAGVLLAECRELDVPRPHAGRSLERLVARLRELARWDAGHPAELAQMIPHYGDDVARATDLAATVLRMSYREQAELLAETDPTTRAVLIERSVSEALARAEADAAATGNRRARPGALGPAAPLDGEPPPWVQDAARLEQELHAAPLSAAVRAVALRELDHLRRSIPTSPEAGRIRNYLEWVLELPWPSYGQARRTTRNVSQVAALLQRSHEGLAEVKERVIEFLAVHRLGGAAGGAVLCFLGPPGTGKSSMGRAVADALERPFLALPVGAIVSEREIVGLSHRQESGAPGVILSGLHRCRSAEPVVLLDEIDKLSLGGEGKSAGALMQLLDPEQNAEFLDHYLGAPYDLSRCLFLATANDLDEIPAALRDRMEIIEFSGYTESEKYRIARRHLLPRARAQAGIDAESLRLSPSALRAVIRAYTEEAGVRDLQRQLVALARKAAVRVVKDGQGISVTRENLGDLLGPRRVEEDVRQRQPEVGIATGLAWTSVGGALLPIEAIAMPGGGRMMLTGHIGDIMRESVQTAVSWARNAFDAFGIPPETMDQVDVHLHFPSAATPKDGPSAGIAIAAALVSLIARWPARHDVAMTGELSLRGQVLGVGGIREKLLAAIRAGIPEVVLPRRNAEDVMRLPAELRRPLVIHLVDNAYEALRLALVPGQPKGKVRRGGRMGVRRAARGRSGPKSAG